MPKFHYRAIPRNIKSYKGVIARMVIPTKQSNPIFYEIAALLASRSPAYRQAGNDRIGSFVIQVLNTKNPQSAAAD